MKLKCVLPHCRGILTPGKIYEGTMCIKDDETMFVTFDDTKQWTIFQAYFFEPTVE